MAALYSGVDYSWSRPNLKQMKAMGIKFATRYFSYRTDSKNLTLAEAKALTAAGIAIVSNWEQSTGDALGGFDAGVAHATEANKLHLAAGGPPDRPIYMSIDFDVQEDQLPVCLEYMNGAASILGKHRVGIYGGYRAIKFFAEQGFTWFWQTYGWSKFNGVTRWYPGTHIQQYLIDVEIANGKVGLERAMQKDYGQWMVGKSTPPIVSPPPAFGDNSALVGKLQARLTALGYRVPTDNSYGAFTAAAVSKWFMDKTGVTYDGKYLTPWMSLQLGI